MSTLRDRRNENDLPVIPIPSDDEVNAVLDKHYSLLQMQDAVYSSLRIIAPTEKEMGETEERIAMMEKLWTELEFSITPKAHLIFRHAAKDQRDFGGLGDKIEDSLEQVHQEQIRYDHVLLRMRGCKRKLKKQATMRWRDGNPDVIEWIDEVKQKTSYPMKRKKIQRRDIKSVALRRKAKRDVKRETAVEKVKGE